MACERKGSRYLVGTPILAIEEYGGWRKIFEFVFEKGSNQKSALMSMAAPVRARSWVFDHPLSFSFP